MNCYGATLAGGVGKLLADWIVDGIPSQDVSKIDVARFLNVHSNKQYLARRVPEIAGKPQRQRGTIKWLPANI